MRKIMLLGGLALAASTAAAGAATVISLDGYCNAYTMRNSNGIIAMKDGGCSTGFGLGRTATVRGSGKTAIMALTDPSSSSFQFQFVFSYPFVTGGTWTLFSTSDGKNANTVLSGTYTIPSGGQPALYGPRSVTSPQ